jgi:hypothetical protein
MHLHRGQISDNKSANSKIEIVIFPVLASSFLPLGPPHPYVSLMAEEREGLKIRTLFCL